MRRPGGLAAAQCTGANPCAHFFPPIVRRPQLAVYTPEGECLVAYSGYQDLLGIKAVAWSPSGQLLAMGDYEQVGGAGWAEAR